VPLPAANEAEQAIIASWQSLETGVNPRVMQTAWAPHIAEPGVVPHQFGTAMP